MNNSCFSQNLNSIDCLSKAIRTVSLRASQWYACLLALPWVQFPALERNGTKTKLQTQTYNIASSLP